MRRVASFALLLVLSIASHASAQLGPSGSWKIVFVDETNRPRPFADVRVFLTAKGQTLNGTVHAGCWPGAAPISEGTVEGDKVAFTAIGTLESSGGLPKLTFTGTTDGDRMKVTMTLTFMRGKDSYTYAMEGERQQNLKPDCY